MKKLFFFGVFIALFISLSAQHTKLFRGAECLDSLQKFTSEKGKFHNSDGFDKNFFDDRINTRLNQPTETTLDSVIDYLFYSEVDSIRVTKGVYEYYPWGDWKTDYIWNWDDLSSKWMFFEKVEYVFDTNSIFQSYNVFSWDDTQNDWKNYQHVEFDYDESGNRIKYTSLIWSEESSRWDNQRLTEYEWDDNGNRIKYVSSNGDGNSGWIPQFKKDYSFNNDGNRTLELSSSWDESLEDWVNGSKREYYYNTFGLRDSSLSYAWETDLPLIWEANKKVGLNSKSPFSQKRQNAFDGFWDMRTKTEYAYDENDLLTTTYLSWWIDDMWDLSSKDEYEYDDHGRSIIYINFMWDDESEIWRNNFKSVNEYTYVFDEDGTPVMFSSYDWEPDMQAWVGRRKYNFIYDDEGKSSLDIIYDWSDNDWSVDEKSFYYRSIITQTPEMELNNFLVYPNPVKNTLFIKNQNSKNISCTIVSNSGQQLMQFDIKGSDARISMEKLPKGVYFLQINSESGTITKKVIKY